MAVRFVQKYGKVRVDRRALRRMVQRILTDHGREASDVTLVLAGDDFVRSLNRDYRGSDRLTDVLAFSLGDDGLDRGAERGDAPRILGDVVVSVDRAAVQARRYRRDLEDEIRKLLAHGVLHLLGYDHETPEDKRRMRRLENGYVRWSVGHARG